MAGSIDSQRL